jgi:hypothetical protein
VVRLFMRQKSKLTPTINTVSARGEKHSRQLNRHLLLAAFLLTRL